MDRLDSDMEAVRARSVANQNMSGAAAVGFAYAGHPYPKAAGAGPVDGSGNDNMDGDLKKEIAGPVKAPKIE